MTIRFQRYRSDLKEALKAMDNGMQIARITDTFHTKYSVLSTSCEKTGINVICKGGNLLPWTHVLFAPILALTHRSEWKLLICKTKSMTW
ncbi:hypothetical protein NDU88_010056 [Pleurodeles waltl]|uniref:Uncharacterized protein n=1 Tax=Pleurodeles waltl TaxID=8319 RepID=A0AAV7S062_PLEWA|nr:hypothetical protein NDU88_010056 [Pleurodeles waltl]